jgi:site-specific recombinase XerD
LQTASAAGLRLAEVVRLQVGDSDAPRRLLHGRAATGRQGRLVPLPAVLLELLRASGRQDRPGRWLFPGQAAAGHLSRGQVPRSCRQAVRAAGSTQKASRHPLRPSSATPLWEQGVDLMARQQRLGHNQVRTALRYTPLRQEAWPRLASPLDTLAAAPASAGTAEPSASATPPPPAP